MNISAVSRSALVQCRTKWENMKGKLFMRISRLSICKTDATDSITTEELVSLAMRYGSMLPWVC